LRDGSGSAKPPDNIAGYKLGMMMAEVRYLSKLPVDLEKRLETESPDCSFEIWTVDHEGFDTFKLYVHRGQIFRVVAKKRQVMSNIEVNRVARNAVSKFGTPEMVSCGFVSVPSVGDCPSRFSMGVHYRDGERGSETEVGFDVNIWGDEYEDEMKFRGQEIEGEAPKGITFNLWKGREFYGDLLRRCGQ